MRAKIFLVLMIVSALLLGECFAADQIGFQSEANGYSISELGGWVQVPDSVLRETLEPIFSGAEETNFVWEAAFQRDTGGMGFEYPYAVVQVIKYSSLGLDRQMYRSEFTEFAMKLIGGDENGGTAGLSADAQGRVSDAVLDKVTLEAENESYSFGLEMDVEDAGKVKSQIKGYFGKHAIIQVMFYDLESNWSNSAKERDSILSSFAFAPAMAYDNAFEAEAKVQDDALEDEAIADAEDEVVADDKGGSKGVKFALLGVGLVFVFGLFKLISAKKKSNEG